MDWEQIAEGEKKLTMPTKDTKKICERLDTALVNLITSLLSNYLSIHPLELMRKRIVMTLCVIVRDMPVKESKPVLVYPSSFWIYTQFIGLDCYFFSAQQ
jgi:hypothetical protein